MWLTACLHRPIGRSNDSADSSGVVIYSDVLKAIIRPLHELKKSCNHNTKSLLLNNVARLETII